jgi:hypothetical protein
MRGKNRNVYKNSKLGEKIGLDKFTEIMIS